jgi:hypothetical protein
LPSLRRLGLGAVEMSAPFWVGTSPLTPWFRNRLDDDGRALLRWLRDEGLDVHGFASSARGPFTARVGRDGLTLSGVGSTPTEALTRLVEKVTK